MRCQEKVHHGDVWHEHSCSLNTPEAECHISTSLEPEIGCQRASVRPSESTTWLVNQWQRWQHFPIIEARPKAVMTSLVRSMKARRNRSTVTRGRCGTAKSARVCPRICSEALEDRGADIRNGSSHAFHAAAQDKAAPRHASEARLPMVETSGRYDVVRSLS